MQKKPMSMLLAALLGTTLLGMSAVAISQTEDEQLTSPLFATSELQEPPLEAMEPLPADLQMPPAVEPAPALNPEPQAVLLEPQPAPAPEVIEVTVTPTEGDYQDIFVSMDGNRNGVIEPGEYRPGALPDSVIARIQHERQMARTDGRQEGGYEAPAYR